MPLAVWGPLCTHSGKMRGPAERKIWGSLESHLNFERTTQTKHISNSRGMKPYEFKMFVHNLQAQLGSQISQRDTGVIPRISGQKVKMRTGGEGAAEQKKISAHTMQR